MRNDRWSSREEILEAISPGADRSAGGPVLYCRGRSYWKHTGEAHTIVVGATGTGKSRRCSIPEAISLVQAEESLVVYDPKAQIYRAAAPYLSGAYQTYVVNLRDIWRSDAWNPFLLIIEYYRSADPQKKQLAQEMLEDLAYALYPDTTVRDVYWPLAARSLFLGAVYALLDPAPSPEEINIASIYQFVRQGDLRCGANTCLKEFVNSLPPDSIARLQLMDYIGNAGDTRGSIRGCFYEGLSYFAKNEGLLALLSASDGLRIADIDPEKPFAVFVISPDETAIYGCLVGLLLDQLMRRMVRLAEERYGGRLPRRVNFLVEEAASVKIPSLKNLAEAGRGRNVRCTTIWQNLSQMEVLYGAANAGSIRENAGVLVAYRVNDYRTLLELSRKCGERMVEQANGALHCEPLITPSQLWAMDVGQALVCIDGRTRFISQLDDYTELFGCESAKLPVRAPNYDRPKPKLFDLQAYVGQLQKQAAPEFFGSREDLPPFLHGSVHRPPKDMDEYIRRLDEKIAELEAAEAAEREAQQKPWSFELTGYHKSKAELAQAIRREAGTTVKKAREILQSLPHTFRFESREEMRSAMQKLLEAGGEIAPLTGEADEDEPEPLPAGLEAPELYSVVLVEVPPQRRVEVSQILQSMMQLPLPQARKLLDKLPYPLDFGSEKEAAQKAAQALQNAGAVIFTLGFEPD